MMRIRWGRTAERAGWFCAGAACAAAAFLIAPLPSFSSFPSLPAGPLAAASPPVADGPVAAPVAVARTAPVVSRLSVVGVVEAGRAATVVAPFTGLVTEKRFEFGQTVERGQVLLIMDGGELEMRLRDAEATLLKAAQRLEELTDWPKGVEVARAQRQVGAARREAEQARLRLIDARPLIEKGIIPRQEYEDLQRQAEAQRVGLVTAEEELAATLKRGGADVRRMAELEHAGATAKVADLKAQLARGVVTAPASGLLLRAPAATAPGGASGSIVEAGSLLSGNQGLFMIAGLDRMTVSARVDEMDVNRIHVGQPVEVTGEGFPGSLPPGRVAWVARQAATTDAGSTAASFGIRVELPALSDAQRSRMRIGMSANLTIKVYESDASVVVPPEAVRWTSEGTVLRVRDPSTGSESDVPVVVGETTENALEIRSGLRTGEQVVLAQPAR